MSQETTEVSQETPEAVASEAESSPESYETLPTPDLIAGIRSGWACADRLPAERRRECVEHLTLEGMTTPEIARMLRITERTVRRDRSENRREQAVAADDSLGDQLLGEFERITQASVGRLARLAHEPQTPPYVRLWAEEAIVRTYQRFIDTARKTGHVREQDRLSRKEEVDLAHLLADRLEAQ